MQPRQCKERRPRHGEVVGIQLDADALVAHRRAGGDGGAGAHERVEHDALSEREREVLRLLALGHTNQEIAKLLYISVRTAETHRAHIMQKLRLSSRAELVRYALAEGLLEEPEPPGQ